MAAHPQPLPGSRQILPAGGRPHGAADDPQSRFGAGHQNIAAVLQEVERLGIPRVL